MNNRVTRVVRKHLFTFLKYSNAYSNVDLEITIIDETLSTARKKIESIKEEDNMEMKFEHLQYLSSTPM